MLNVGPKGLDEVGDSLFLPPPRAATCPSCPRVISAPAGTELHYLCAIHPWMQGEIDVRGDRRPTTTTAPIEAGGRRRGTVVPAAY